MTPRELGALARHRQLALVHDGDLVLLPPVLVSPEGPAEHVRNALMLLDGVEALVARATIPPDMDCVDAIRAATNRLELALEQLERPTPPVLPRWRRWLLGVFTW